MRLKISLFVVAAVSAATSAVLLNAGSATARVCPPGTIPKTVYVAGHPVDICVPGQQCDPRPCDPTAAPNQD